jgi:hypothetical protein
MFETFEDGPTYYVSGPVFVIAIINRDTLELVDYVERAFMTKEDADDYEFHTDHDPSLAYIVQEKKLTVAIHGDGYESKA